MPLDEESSPVAYRCFDATVQDRVAHIVLSRPERRNSRVPAFREELPAIVREIDDEGKARVIVMSFLGPHFTSGLDLDAFLPEADSGREEGGSGAAGSGQGLPEGLALYETIGALQESFTTLERCRLPVLAAIQGGCIGGGVDLVTACDMRYATADAFFSVYEINIGLTADAGTFPRLLAHVPEGIARELACAGRRMGAEEARSVGLVNRVFPDREAMLEGVLGVAGEIAAKAPLAVHGCKRIITHARDHTTADTLEQIAAWNAGMLDKAVVREAVRAAKAGRPPPFPELPPRRGS